MISVFKGGKKVTQANVRTVDFTVLDSRPMPDGLRVFPDAPSISQDLETEYIAFSPFGRTVWVTLQEANAVAIVNTWSGSLEKVVPLGTIDHLLPGFGLDGSDKDGAINIANGPVSGVFMPDAIASVKTRGGVFYITANEGDDRGGNESIGDIELDPSVFPNTDELQGKENLGRLGASTIDGGSDFDELFTYGTRSFTIWNSKGEIGFDSGDDFETITSMLLPDDFNANNDETVRSTVAATTKPPCQNPFQRQRRFSRYLDRFY